MKSPTLADLLRAQRDMEQKVSAARKSVEKFKRLVSTALSDAGPLPPQLQQLLEQARTADISEQKQ